MSDVRLVKATRVSLKAHPHLNEKWLQERIVEDPTLLGLGDLAVKDVERRQPRAGRLDLLLSDPDSNRRYEVEIQLGATDEAHIIRTIEYWDIEKSRYPQYEHVAVIVAEDITSRFLNVISLLNKTIPLIAIQMQALQVGEALTLHATTVLDLTSLGTEEEDEPGQATDRSYWVGKGTPETIAIADELLELINEITPGMAFKYNKFYIGLTRNGVVDNFITLRIRKDFVLAEPRIPRTEELTAMLDEAGVDRMDYDSQWGRYRLRLRKSDLVERRDLLLDLIRRASDTPAPLET
ncbi:hypothetical protein [Rhodococcus pyridinivorans]|uniref:hypothetical protein n=1 Tax=Rhodococcus pyridinivorans TaxID=103816 RepID=UPI0011867A13|nr:hypothetical protein [Rhodococcus pyridinivorans]